MSILDTIDGAIEDWTTSADAMRWAPPPVRWDEPIVRDPRTLVERLTLDGWDGYAAQAYTYRNAWPVAMRQIEEGFRVIGEAFAKSFRPLRDALIAIGRLSEQPQPEPDARERALQLRQQRHTGPAPRRLDGRGR